MLQLVHLQPPFPTLDNNLNGSLSISCWSCNYRIIHVVKRVHPYTCNHCCRAAVRVLDLAVADEVAPITTLVDTLLRWHEALCAPPYAPEYFATLEEALPRLRAALEPFNAIGVSVNLPKLHRAKDFGAVVRAFGGARIVSTDAYEKAHKALKKVFLRYVPYVRHEAFPTYRYILTLKVSYAGGLLCILRCTRVQSISVSLTLFVMRNGTVVKRVHASTCE